MGCLGCFVRTGWAGIGKGSFACCATNTADESKSGLQPAGSPANWRCIVLEKLSRVKVTGRCLADSAKPFSPCLLCGDADIDAEDQPSAIRKKDSEAVARAAGGPAHAQRGDRVRIMPLGANAATRAGGSPAAAPGLIIQDGRRGRRGKNGSARPPGTHTLRCKAWRDGEIRANSVLHSGPIPTPA